MATKCDEQIDSYDNLEFELPSYFDAANQLVARPREHYRWIRERIVWGWDYNKLTREYMKTFKLDPVQAAWTVKGEVGRLVTKIRSFILNSQVSELIAWSRIDFIYDNAVRDGNYELALNAQRELNTMVFRHKAKFRPTPASTPGGSNVGKKRSPKKTSVVKETDREEKPMKPEFDGDDIAWKSDEELFEELKKRRLLADGVSVKKDQHGNTIPVISPETASRLIQESLGNT